MALLGPDAEDKRKIHSEINQIVNQRLAITTLSVTIFGVMIAWLIPSKNTFADGKISDYTFFTTYLLLVILFSLFLLAHHLTSMLRLMTTYLAETKSSTWEIDWKKYRGKHKYWGYTKPLTIIFLVLGEISVITPFFFVVVFKLQYECIFGIFSTIIGIFYFLMVWGMGFRGFFAREDVFKQRWEELNKE